MRIYIIVLAVICSFLAPPQLFAWGDDLGEIGAKIFFMTDAQVRQYYKDRLDNRSVKGRGAILDVVGGPDTSQYTVFVDLGNGVIASMRSESMGLKELRLQQTVDFSGTLNKVEKFQDIVSGRAYVSFTLNNASVSKY
jgi:hypothetical protein